MELGTREMPPKKGKDSQPLGRPDATGPQSGEVLQGRYTVSYTHLRAHETVLDLVCRLLLEKKNT